MKLKIVKLDIRDNDIVGMPEYPNGILATYYLVNPNKAKLAELKNMVENRFEYQYDESISDEDFDKAEELANNIWEAIDLFIDINFVVLDIDETYEIAY